MGKPKTLLLAGLFGAGLAAGFASKRATRGQVVPPSIADDARPMRGHAGFAGLEEKIIRPAVHSADTVETLAALDETELFARLAAWLLDADALDIAAFWKGYAARGNCRIPVKDLILIHWTRLDPQAAIAAVAETPDAGEAWWAWTCSDPQAALAAAIAAGPKWVSAVAEGIGEFHPAWLKEHFAEIPEENRSWALNAVGKWDTGGDPTEMLEFARDQRLDPDLSSFSALVRQDPVAAWEMVREHVRSGVYSWTTARFISQMAEEDPAELARLAALTPAGEVRRQMDAAVFANLIQTDPDAALASAKSAEVPRVAAERLAAVGLSIAESDPEQAFELAGTLLSKCPAAFRIMNRVLTPSGGGGASGSAVRGVNPFMDALFNHDPARLMDLVVAAGDPKPHENAGYGDYRDKWVERDPDAFAEWVKLQNDPSYRQEGTKRLVWRLQEMHQYQDAVDWAMTLPLENGRRVSSVQSVVGYWARDDRSAARSWLETADLPAAAKSNLMNYLSQ